MDVKYIVEQFETEGIISEINPFGGGHINDTYRLIDSQNRKKGYLLQKVNSFVFKDVDSLMLNTSIVTSHIRNKLVAAKVDDIERKSLRLIPTKSGKTFFKDEAGHFWRMFNFIGDNRVYDTAPNLKIAFEGARMFGEFLALLSDLDPNLLKDTIPHFHNIKRRLSNLEMEIKSDKMGRVKYVLEDIAYVRSSQDIMQTIQNYGEKGLIPLRITHNDTKINNVLFDEFDEGLCIVDLDTVMPGFVHYDYGDGIRTTANTGEEDDQDLKNVGYDLKMVESFSAGYIKSTHHLLNKVEIASLVHGALLFPFIMGVRFLTDFIAGDVYYKTHYEDHNMYRCKAQLKLAQDGEAKLKDMEKIIKSIM